MYLMLEASQVQRAHVGRQGIHIVVTEVVRREGAAGQAWVTAWVCMRVCIKERSVRQQGICMHCAPTLGLARISRCSCTSCRPGSHRPRGGCMHT